MSSLILIVKVQLEKGLRESNQLVVDPPSNRIIIGMFDRNDELILAVEFDEDGSDLKLEVQDDVFVGAVMNDAD